MNYEEYLSLIKLRFKKKLNFNISNDIEEKGMKIDLFANSIFLTNDIIKNKAVPFTKYEIYEKYYIKHYKNITYKEIQEYFEFLHLLSDDAVPISVHLQRCIVGIMICDFIDEKYKSYIEGLKYTKPYGMYFKGWSEIQLICVDLNINEIYFNNVAQKNNELFLSDILSPCF